jgi:hypothetical protein
MFLTPFRQELQGVVTMGVTGHLGFIVEGDADRAVVEALAGRLLHGRWHFYTVRIGGKAALPSAHWTAALFFEKGYERVVLVFDVDSNDPADYAAQKQEVEESLRSHHVGDGTSVCPALPSVWTWLLAGHVENPESIGCPKDELARALGTTDLRVDDLQALAEGLDLAARRSPSLKHFVEVLAEIRSTAAPTPAPASH